MPLMRRLLMLVVGLGLTVPRAAGAQSGTAEIDQCLQRPTLARVLKKTPVPPVLRDFITSSWNWIGVSRRSRNRAAQDHFSRGGTLYNQGDYEGAIIEFVAAYCDVPHYTVLYNIAQSFERLVQYERAVAYLERMIKETPPAASAVREKLRFRVQVLKKLPAQIKVATMPPGATVTLLGSHGIAAQGAANKDTPLKVRSGRYRLQVHLPGYEPIGQWIDVQIGQPYSYYFSLKPLTGTLEVLTDPPDARIFIDNRLVAKGAHVERMPIGKYSLRIEADDHVTKKNIPIEVRDGRTTKLNISLDQKPRSGRLELIVASSLGGASLGGGAFTTIFGENSTAASLGSALGLGIGIVGGYFGVPKNIPVGSSSFIIGSTLVGAAEAALVAAWINCDPFQKDSGTFDEHCDVDVISGAAVAGSVAGLLFAAITEDKLRFSAGDAAVINSGAIWGSVAGALFFASFDSDPRIAEPVILAGLNLGILGGGLIAARNEISRSHSALIDVAGLAGMIAGVALVDVIEPGTRSERLPHFALAGMTVGLITGTYLTRNMDEPTTVPIRTLKPQLSGVRDITGRATATIGMGGMF